jgi:hypothetical protein
VPLPKFAADVLNARHVRFIVGQAEVIFPSSVGAACLRASGQINSATPKCR